MQLPGTPAGNLYVAGEIFSLQGSSSGTYDAFVLKLNPAGTSLIFSAMLIGAGSDSAKAIAADSTGIWVAGYTTSVDFPVSGSPASSRSMGFSRSSAPMANRFSSAAISAGAAMTGAWRSHSPAAASLSWPASRVRRISRRLLALLRRRTTLF